MVWRSPNQTSRPVFTSQSQPTRLPASIASRRRSCAKRKSVEGSRLMRRCVYRVSNHMRRSGLDPTAKTRNACRYLYQAVTKENGVGCDRTRPRCSADADFRYLIHACDLTPKVFRYHLFVPQSRLSSTRSSLEPVMKLGELVPPSHPRLSDAVLRVATLPIAPSIRWMPYSPFRIARFS